MIEINFKEEPLYTTQYGAAYLGDALTYLRQMECESVDLIVTSPPFALKRKKAGRSLRSFRTEFIPEGARALIQMYLERAASPSQVGAIFDQALAALMEVEYAEE